jgi:hypothetical protein
MYLSTYVASEWVARSPIAVGLTEFAESSAEKFPDCGIHRPSVKSLHRLYRDLVMWAVPDSSPSASVSARAEEAAAFVILGKASR